MARKLPKIVRAHLEKAQLAALSAVEAYNRPGSRFRTGQFLVLIVIAWTALLHAIFYQRGIKPWYRAKGSGRGKGTRYERIDGEPKHWDLAHCLGEYFGGELPPERKNLELLLGLRNKIEHRHLPELDPALYGYCQAALLNLETLLEQEFGAQWALNESLAIALQFSRVTPKEKQKALKALASSQSRTVREYLQLFLGGLSPEVRNDQTFSFEVYLIPKIGRENRADLAVEFVPHDPSQPEQKEAMETAIALIREKQVPVAYLDHRKPSEVVREVAKRLPFRFTTHHHTQCWKFFQVRPDPIATQKDRTQSQYCVYDRAHRDYLYTKAWVEKLVGELSNPDTYARVIGKRPEGKAPSESLAGVRAG